MALPRGSALARGWVRRKGTSDAAQDRRHRVTVVIGHRAMLARQPEENISPSIRILTENIEARHS